MGCNLCAFAGMNHAQFASGEERKLFPGALPLDLNPDVDHDRAIEQVQH